MTNSEILNLAFNGLCMLMDKERELNEKTKKEYGHEDSISVAKLEKYNEQYNELRKLILKEACGHKNTVTIQRIATYNRQYDNLRDVYDN